MLPLSKIQNITQTLIRIVPLLYKNSLKLMTFHRHFGCNCSIRSLPISLFPHSSSHLLISHPLYRTFSLFLVTHSRALYFPFWEDFLHHSPLLKHNPLILSSTHSFFFNSPPYLLLPGFLLHHPVQAVVSQHIHWHPFGNPNRPNISC